MYHFVDKINMFEKNIEKDSIEYKISNITLKDNNISKPEELNSTSRSRSETDSKPLPVSVNSKMENENILSKNIPEKVYKSNIEKFNFLQTQLADDTINVNKSLESIDVTEVKDKDCENIIEHNITKVEEINDTCNSVLKENSNVTDDNRIANSSSSNIEHYPPLENTVEIPLEQEISISVPPRRKKQNAIEKALASAIKKEKETKLNTKEYPDHLNPFSDDDEDEVIC